MLLLPPLVEELDPAPDPLAVCERFRASASITLTMDTSVVIRTYLALGARVYLGVGEGMVADSDPEEEYRETFRQDSRAHLGAGRWRMILLIDNYDSFVHNLARYTRELGGEPPVRRNDAVTLDEIAALEPAR